MDGVNSGLPENGKLLLVFLHCRSFFWRPPKAPAYGESFYQKNHGIPPRRLPRKTLSAWWAWPHQIRENQKREPVVGRMDEVGGFAGQIHVPSSAEKNFLITQSFLWWLDVFFRWTKGVRYCWLQNTIDPVLGWIFFFRGQDPRFQKQLWGDLVWDEDFLWTSGMKSYQWNPQGGFLQTSSFEEDRRKRHAQSS